MTEPIPHRKRLHRREVYLQPRFITFSCQQRLPLFRNGTLAALFVESLQRARERHGFLLIAWVVMPEHVHLLIVPRPGELPEARTSCSGILSGIKRPVSEAALRRWVTIGWTGLERLKDSAGRARFWQTGGGFDRNIRNASEFAETVRYIHMNPVERGISSTPESYPWSSALAHQSGQDKPIPIDRQRYGEPWRWWETSLPPRRDRRTGKSGS